MYNLFAPGSSIFRAAQKGLYNTGRVIGFIGVPNLVILSLAGYIVREG